MKMSNVKALQNLIRTEQFTAIISWNKDRNQLVYNEMLEADMLREEAQEYFDATTIVDKLDAVADFLFVAVGTVSKGTYSFESTFDFTDPLDTILSDFAGVCISEGIDISFVGELVSDGLGIVVQANQQKTAEKNAEGKIQKPEGFVPPEEALAELIKAAKSKEVAPPPTVQNMFEGQ